MNIPEGHSLSQILLIAHRYDLINTGGLTLFRDFERPHAAFYRSFSPFSWGLSFGLLFDEKKGDFRADLGERQAP